MTDPFNPSGASKPIARTSPAMQTQTGDDLGRLKGMGGEGLLLDDSHLLAAWAAGEVVCQSILSKKVYLMATQQVTLDIPDRVILAEKTDVTSFGHEIKMLAAVKLYELGRLSSGSAAELAGVSRVAFLSSLSRYKVFPLLAELHDVEREHG